MRNTVDSRYISPISFTMDEMKNNMMMANVYQGVGKPSKWMQVEKPKLLHGIYLYTVILFCSYKFTRSH